MLSRWLTVLIWLAMLSLTSCGFQLRGSTPLSQPLHILFIKTADPYGSLARSLRDYLQMSGVKLVDNTNDATTVLHIVSETKNQQLLSVSGTQQTRQYNLTLTVTFEITTPKGIPLTPLFSLSETRIFTTLSDQVLGGSNEQNMIYQQMQPALVYNMMIRLGSQDVTTILMKNL